MRKLFVVATVALLAGSAWADEPAACYQHTDASGDFTPRTVLAAEPAMAARINHLRNEDSPARSAACKNTWPRKANGRVGPA